MILTRRFIFPLAVLLASIPSSRLSAQSNAAQPGSAVLAIVGARIVDGSGNEPFDGTVVVRDGRIAEVGRTVRPPEGARIIDAHGRIVTPGLIDVRVHLPAGATDDALARLMAAFLYAGVTSIGVADLDENKLDTLRDHLSIAKIRAPRLVAAMAPAGAMLASSLGSSMPDASAFADWKKRNATFVPELVAASDRKIALDRLRAAQQAGVRIAVGSNAGAPDLPAGSLPAGSSTLREMRSLLEAGLTPLQALTAVTSGSAWALGLQSDRAFLAVGQRGDLAILAGEPSATSSADAPLVEQVFVGGEEIDRAALNAIITRPAATPPETTSAANTPAGNATGAAGATGGTTAAPVKPGAAGSGKTARAGRKGRTRPGAGGAGETKAPEASTAAETTPTAPSASTTPPPATAPEPTLPAVTPSTTPPVAPTPTPAPAAAAAAAPIPVADPVIDDFESGGGDRTGLGPIWNASNDSGSAADVILGRVVRGLRDHALHVTARMGDNGEPYARITVALAHDGHPADVSQFHGLRFDARGQGRYRVVFVTRSVTDGRYHESYFSGSPLWTPVSIPFGTLGQTGAGRQVKWTGTDLLEIAFQIAREPGQMGWLELDNLRFY